MPRIFGNLSTIKLDVRKVKALLHEQLLETLRQGAKIWVLTAQENIPIWSGASQSTLKTLAGKVGVDIAVFPVSGAPDRTALGEGSGRGDLEINRGAARYSFFYSTNLPYLIRNETQNMDAAMRGRLRTPTPYQFRLKADAAFKDFIKSKLDQLPVNSILRNSIKVTQLRTK